jgi:hypothetical protein
MIRIRLLVYSFCILSGTAWAQNEAESTPAKPLWPCGASLLPCKLPGEAARPTLPYWRGNVIDRPMRASYTPAFPKRITR